jgi:hypothetical protein
MITYDRGRMLQLEAIHPPRDPVVQLDLELTGGMAGDVLHQQEGGGHALLAGGPETEDIEGGGER